MSAAMFLVVQAQGRTPSALTEPYTPAQVITTGTVGVTPHDLYMHYLVFKILDPASKRESINVLYLM